MQAAEEWFQHNVVPRWKDRSFDYSVEVYHADGSHFTLSYAQAVKKTIEGTTWLWVMTDHQGNFIFDVEDLIQYRQVAIRVVNSVDNDGKEMTGMTGTTSLQFCSYEDCEETVDVKDDLCPLHRAEADIEKSTLTWQEMAGNTDLEKQVNFYLTKQFVFIPGDDTPKDECLTEARTIIDMIAREWR